MIIQMVVYKASLFGILLPLVILTAMACSSSGGNHNAGKDMVFPVDDWEESSPESQGVDPEKLRKAISYLDANAGGAGASEVVVIRNGYMIWKGSNIDRRHSINSGTKTFTTAVLGLLVQDGKMTLDTDAVKHLPALDDRYPAYGGITFRHLATMTSGYAGEEGKATQNTPWGEPERYLTPTVPLSTPGTAFRYHDPAVHLLGYILTRVAEEPLQEVFKRRIADPIGMTDWEWKDYGPVDGVVLNNPSGIYEGGIHISARQMARFGHLYLNGGNWNGRQLIDATWVEQATTNQVPTALSAPSFDLRGRYGFMWWTNGTGANGKRPWPSAPAKTYTSYGGARNFCWVIPEWKMVIVRMEKTVRMSYEDKVWDNFFAILKKGITLSSNNSPLPVIAGEMKAWYPITIDFRGPLKSESDDEPNPFLDYRLQVTFAGPDGLTYAVPGFFDGDGSGSGSGHIWRVRFTPDRSGEWSFKASFRAGRNISLSLDPTEGTPTAFDGANGAFSVSGRDEAAPGFFGKGRLVYAGGFYLRTIGDGKYWIKGGTDSPENFLGYRGFDGASARPERPELFHAYDRHVRHWKEGDPDWGDGKGKGIIGTLNYLSSRNVNSIYLLTMNIGGDGQDVWPYAGSIDRAGSKGNDNRHFSLRRLRQWEIVFSHAQRLGIYLNLVLSEGEKKNKQELDDAGLGVERKLYYREMIARFGHHNALQWMLCEEYDHNELPIPPEMVRSWAGYIRSIDPYRHPISVHNMKESAWDPFFGDDRFDVISYQYFPGKVSYGQKVEELRAQSIKAGRPIPVNMDEFWATGRVDDENFAQIGWHFVGGHGFIRKNILWPVYLSGGNLEYILQDTLSNDDFTLYEKMWDYTWHARKFMEENLPFWEMVPMDHLLSGSVKGEVFAKPGEIYAIYLPSADSIAILTLKGVSGAFDKRWYNPRAGRFEGTTATVHGSAAVYLGLPPRDVSEDWVVFLSKHVAAKGPE